MTILYEGQLQFNFPYPLHPSKYEDWAFYRNRFHPRSKRIDAGK